MSRAASIIAVANRRELHIPHMGTVVGSKVRMLAAAVVVFSPAVGLQSRQ